LGRGDKRKPLHCGGGKERKLAGVLSVKEYDKLY